MLHLINCIIKIKNGYASRQSFVSVRKGKMVLATIRKLVSNDIIRFFKTTDNGFNIHLYKNNRIRTFVMLNRGGGDRFVSAKEVYHLSAKYRYAFISTNMGVMTHIDCIREGIGGKPLFYIEK